MCGQFPGSIMQPTPNKNTTCVFYQGVLLGCTSFGWGWVILDCWPARVDGKKLLQCLILQTSVSQSVLWWLNLSYVIIIFIYLNKGFQKCPHSHWVPHLTLSGLALFSHPETNSYSFMPHSHMGMHCMCTNLPLLPSSSFSIYTGPWYYSLLKPNFGRGLALMGSHSYFCDWMGEN